MPAKITKAELKRIAAKPGVKKRPAGDQSALIAKAGGQARWKKPKKRPIADGTVASLGTVVRTAREANLGAVLRTARESEGITLPTLAERSGVSLGFLSRVENGGSVPRREKFQKVVDVLARDQTHARQLHRRRDLQELVDRFGLDEGIATLAVVLADERRSAGAIRRAIDLLTQEQATALYTELAEEEAAAGEPA